MPILQVLPYSGDSQWYIEASANWFATTRNPLEPRNFLEGESLVRLPHVPLWLSYDNFPVYYPENWQRYVHQYGLAMLLYYLSEEANISSDIICDGFFANTDELPQEYLFNQIGSTEFRNHFINWAAQMTNGFDFLTPEQIAVVENEWEDYADLADDNEFIQILNDEGTNGWYTPTNSRVTRGWSFNTYKINNTLEEDYIFELKGDEFGSDGDPSFFQGKIVVKNAISGTSFYDLTMMDQLEGSFTLTANPDDTEIYFIIAAMPEIFEGVHQNFTYEARITKGSTVDVEAVFLNQSPIEIARFNILGQPVSKFEKGIHIIQYSDGKAKKGFNFEGI